MHCSQFLLQTGRGGDAVREENGVHRKAITLQVRGATFSREESGGNNFLWGHRAVTGTQGPSGKAQRRHECSRHSKGRQDTETQAARVGKEVVRARITGSCLSPLTSHYSCWPLSWLKRTFPPTTLKSFNLLETGHILQTRRGWGRWFRVHGEGSWWELNRRSNGGKGHFHSSPLPTLSPIPCHLTPGSSTHSFSLLSSPLPSDPSPTLPHEGIPRKALENTMRPVIGLSSVILEFVTTWMCHSQRDVREQTAFWELELWGRARKSGSHGNQQKPRNLEKTKYHSFSWRIGSGSHIQA